MNCRRSPYSITVERSVAFRRSVGGRLVFACYQKLAARTSSYNAALSSARTAGFALHGESLFPNAEKVTKNAYPSIRVSLRSTSLIPSLLRGAPRKGHPRPFTALAASMPLAPLRSDFIRPPERGVRRRLMVRCRKNWKSVSGQQRCVYVPSRNENIVGWKTAEHFPPRSALKSSTHNLSENRWVSFALPTLRSLEARISASLHVPSDTTKPPLSEGRVQVMWKGLSGMDAARAAMGQGWPFAAGPWNVTGAREPRRSRGRMQGQDFLVPFGATAKRDSPSRAKPSRRPTAPMGPNESSSNPSPTASRPRPLPQTAQPTLPFAARPSGMPAATSQVLPC
ncbi:hypothetical protein A9A72_1231089 [Stutzerimonas stutzeri]|uniref:Uncharacterized protein n=1 Tax=Stutzerimonas stutzeri TaxID=316 RepID=A0A5S5BF33_STUST|nr:hypothetical protein A9A72_1231089 [Stutzerimonas stutzeri]